MVSSSIVSRLTVVSSIVAAATITAFGQSAGPDISYGLFTATPVLNAPFSADATTTITERRKDGTLVEHTITGRYYRDSGGRVRVESDIAGAQPGQPTSFAIIQLKPGDRRVYALNSLTKTVDRLPRDVLEGTYDSAATFAIPVGVSDYRAHIAFSQNDPLVEDVETLGERHIEGLAAVGRRMWRFEDAGMEVTSEWWESADLKVLLSSRLSDPRIGSVLDFRLTKIRRSEPASSLFVIPDDYTVREMPPAGFVARWQRWSPRDGGRTK
jgi:hypothetical protein